MTLGQVECDCALVTRLQMKSLTTALLPTINVHGAKCKQCSRLTEKLPVGLKDVVSMVYISMVGLVHVSVPSPSKQTSALSMLMTLSHRRETRHASVPSLVHQHGNGTVRFIAYDLEHRYD